MVRGLFAALVLLAAAGCFMPDAAPGGVSVSLPAALLRADPYPDLVVRFDYVEGRAPSGSALDGFFETFEGVAEKDSVTPVGPAVIPGAVGERDRAWTQDSLAAFHASVWGVSRHAHDQDGAAFLHVVYLDGVLRLADGREAVGLQAGADIYVFPDSLRRSEAVEVPLPVAERVELQVLRHELGHAFGLVDCGIPMVRPHSAGGCHSTNPESVMHAAVEDSAKARLVEAAQEGEGVHAEFDADDLADLRAFRDAAS